MTDPELEAKLTQWREEEPCFLMLELLWLSCQLEDGETKDRNIDLFLKHYEECGSCWQRVLVVAEGSQDRLKRRVHFNLHYLSLLVYMRHRGGDFAVEESEEGQLIRVKYPSDVDTPWTGGELFLAKSSSRPSWITFDLRDAATFEDPQPVLQQLDAIASFEYKDYDRPGGEAIQWWSILGDRPAAVRVRWEGEVKEIAKDWTVYPRYQKLLRKKQVAEYKVKKKNEAPRPEDTSADEVLLIRRLLQDYDGRSYFAGYVKQTAEFRRKDAWRRQARNPLHGARPYSDEYVLNVRDWESRASTDALVEYLDLRRQLDRLRPLLTDKEAQVFDLKISDDELTDAEVGQRLGIRRDSVNRILKRIRAKAATLEGRN